MKLYFISNAAPTSGPVDPELKDGEIAGIAIAGVFFIIGVVIGFIIGFIFYRKMNKRPQSGIYYLNACTINKAYFVLYIQL